MDPTERGKEPEWAQKTGAVETRKQKRKDKRDRAKQWTMDQAERAAKGETGGKSERPKKNWNERRGAQRKSGKG